MKRKRPQGPSSRPARVGERVREEVSELLSGSTIRDPRLKLGMITVTEVKMSGDLQHAKVYVSLLIEPEHAAEETKRKTELMLGLESVARVLRHTVAERLKIRHAPELHFELDESIAEGAKIEALIREIHAEEPE